MIFKTTVMNGMHAYTAYEGTSQKRAAEAMDAAKAVLLIARGTAWIYVGTPTHPNRLAWSVNEGSATPGPGAVWMAAYEGAVAVAEKPPTWERQPNAVVEASKREAAVMEPDLPQAVRVREAQRPGKLALVFLDEDGRENGGLLHFCSVVCRNEAERHLMREGIAVDPRIDRLPHTGHCGTCGLPV